jgi:hypothetical protein
MSDIILFHLAQTRPGAKGAVLYPGDQQLFTDASHPAYDEGAATLLKQRVLTFLDEEVLA